MEGSLTKNDVRFPMLRKLVFAGVSMALAIGILPVRAEKVPSGTEMTVRLENEVAPDSKKGDTFSGLLAYPLFVNGKEVLPAGTRIEGEIRGNKKKVILSPRYLYLPNNRKVPFNATVKELDGKRLKAEQKEGSISQGGSKADASRQAAEVGLAGAGIGAMSTGSAKGMGIGAAAGVAAVLIGRQVAGRHHSFVIPAGTQLTLNLARPLDVPDNAAEATNQKESSDPDERRPVLRRNP